MARKGMIFGIFLAPFHRVGDNPTLAIRRDIELIAWLDHLGFEVANLPAFCKKLEAMGVTLDVPCAGRTFLTDPWGTYIELTEGFRGV